MSEKLVDGVVTRSELLFTQYAVDEIVAGAAKQSQSASEFGFFEASFRLSPPMTRTRNQVMPREFDLGALA